MARRKTTPAAEGTTPDDQPTGTVQARRKLERERQKQADKLRAYHAAELEAARNATAARLKDKPTDSRTLVEPDPVANL